MNQSTSDRIKRLLEESGLLSTEKRLSNLNSEVNFLNETILITGAAGSIGSEISKQIAEKSFKSLILVDNAESPMYFLQKEFEQFSNLNIHFIIADIRDELSMQEIFECFKPSIVFHTAAYKHVPLMESNPYEAVKLNILATKYLADVSIISGVKKFIFISTDKAVNPISIMGMTKRICERFLDDLNLKNSTKFLITRFGNVLGSNGSLIPIFKNQIESGKPLTITSPKMSRYFINKTKACNLILKIAHYEDWEYTIFTFNMDEPIKIIDLAKTYIALQNIKHEDSIGFEFIGLRPGEKLHEEMISKSETLKGSICNDIMYVIKKNTKKNASLELKHLKSITPYQKTEEIKSILKTYL
jgi:FlaA1/EpsC-like NDP-sugar epimerase